MMKAASCCSRPWCRAKRWRECEHASKCGKYSLCYRWQPARLHRIVSCSYLLSITKISVAWEGQQQHRWRYAGRRRRAWSFPVLSLRRRRKKNVVKLVLTSIWACNVQHIARRRILCFVSKLEIIAHLHCFCVSSHFRT